VVSRASGGTADLTACSLVTIPISHYCEKARWALDRAGVPYRERAHLQLIHRFAVRRAGGGTTAPVLVCDERVFAESAQIVDEADRRAPPDRRLYPTDPEVAAEIRGFERGLDEGFGPQGRMWMYDALRGRRDLAVAYACTGVPGWERRALPALYPLVSRLIDRFLGITPEAAVEALADARTTFDSVAERLGDGRPFLFGDNFTAADLTFSALAAAVLMPPEYGVPLPQPEELPAAAASIVRELRAHPAGAHAMRMFREERRL
jgi:glutathione S-transferase